jgi:hypothetical protein
MDIPNGLKVLFGPCCGIVLQRVHPYTDCVELEGVFIDLELEPHDPSLLGAD